MAQSGIDIGVRAGSEAFGLGVLYLLLTARLEPAELALAALAALQATTLRMGVAASAERRFRRPLWRRLAPGRAAADLLGDSLTVARMLLPVALGAYRRPGRFLRERFVARGEDAETATRRAEAIFVVSLAPNSYVVDIDERRGQMLVHELVPDRGAVRRHIARLGP
jgi:hypothetical protein